MAERKAPGESLSRRLASRSGGLYRRSMPDGGEVYSGPVAREALRTLGARAMTMDGTILVDEDFDVNDPEDRALYAHELHHQLESGGADHPTSQNDAEEMAAQAIERMVLHRSSMGDDFGAILRDVRQGGAGAAAKGEGGGGSAATGKSGLEETSDAEEAYKALRRRGQSHQQIVDDLARHCMDLIRQREEGSQTRQFGSKPW
jgi:hypothetical protein